MPEGREGRINTIAGVSARGATRPLAAFLAATLAVLALVACGDEGSDEGGATTARQERPDAATPNGGSSDGEDSGEKSTQGKAGGGGKDGGQGGGEAPRGGVSTPLRVSGGGSARFRAKGGDNSIQDFGEEADRSELEQAATALHGFYVARAEKRWAKACTFLAASMVEQLEALAQGSDQLKDAGCAGVLRGFTAPLSPRVARETTLVDAASLRHEGGRAFLIYRGEGQAVYAMPMGEEDGEWKVAALAGTPLS